jgi:hypothetical protein
LAIAAVEFGRLGIPVAVHVSVAPIGNQGLGTRLDADAGHHRQIPACRAAGHDDPVGVNLKELRPLFAKPVERILHVLDDRR